MYQIHQFAILALILYLIAVGAVLVKVGVVMLVVWLILSLLQWMFRMSDRA